MRRSIYWLSPMAVRREIIGEQLVKYAYPYDVGTLSIGLIDSMSDSLMMMIVCLENGTGNNMA